MSRSCRIKVDSASATHIAVCSCGWREVSWTRSGAWSLGAEHQARQGYSGKHNALEALFKRKQRGQGDV